MKHEITHITTYEYSHTVSVSHHVLRLEPRGLPNQRCVQSELQIEPRPVMMKSHVDYFGNPITFVTVEGAHQKLVVKSRSQVEINPVKWPGAAETPAWETVRDFFRSDYTGTSLEGWEFIYNSPRIQSQDELRAYAAPSFTPKRAVLEAVMDLTQRIHCDFTFDPKATTVATPVEEVFQARRGVCQDFAQLEIACLRSLGLPARYVSGYLETDPPPGQPRLVGADASHAWVSFFAPEIGWIDVDPTNNVMPSARHLTVAWGRDYSDVSPVRGVILGSGEHSLKVQVDVVPLSPNRHHLEI